MTPEGEPSDRAEVGAIARLCLRWVWLKCRLASCEARAYLRRRVLRKAREPRPGSGEDAQAWSAGLEVGKQYHLRAAELALCPYHLNSLRAALSVRGLDAFIAADQDEVNRRMALAQRADGPTVDCFEPYVMATMAIVGNAVEDGLAHLLVANPEIPSPVCPLCVMQKAHDQLCEDDDCKTDYTAWVGLAADEMLDIAKSFAQ